MSHRRLALAALLAAAPLTPALAGELQVHVLDVGQAAAALVIGPDGTTVLVDGGDPGDGNAAIVPYLQGLGLTGLDYSVLSHWHTDHYGGLDEVFNAGFLPAVAAYDRGNTDMPSGTQVSQYLAAVGSKRQLSFLGQTIPLGDGATMEVVALNGLTPLGTVDPSGFSQEENGRSVAVVVRYKDFDLYLGGDLTGGGNGTADVETWVATHIGRMEVVQASHHGSNTSSQAGVIPLLDPSLVLYSCGEDNSYFHPSKTVVDRWNDPAGARAAWGTTLGDRDNGSGGWTAADTTIVLRTDGYRFRALPAGASATQEVEFATFEHPAVAPAAGDVAITEVMVNPLISADAFGEWFELTNTSPKLIDLGGCEVRAGTESFHLVSRVLLDYGERIVVGVDGRRDRNGDVWVPVTAPFGQFELDNTGETLELRAPDGTVVDAVTFGPGGVATPVGRSAERIDAFAAPTPANFQTATAAYGTGDKGTPANKNTGEASVFAAGLVVPSVHWDNALELRLSAPTEGLKLYFAALSTGTSPGLPLLGLQLPLNADALLFQSLNLPGFSGVLSLLGEAQVTLPLPGDPALIGTAAFAAYLTLGPGLAGSAASNAAPILIE